MNYQRVLPRDLFNEAKLLKCLGQLALLIHNGVGIRWPLRFEEIRLEEGFRITQDPSAGCLSCVNLELYCSTHRIELRLIYNSRSPYPLMFHYDGALLQETGDVFTDKGELDVDFTSFLDRLVEV